MHKDGSPITIGEVKRKINLWLAEHGVENPEGTIFAIGRDAGIPHSTGTATDALRLGQTIVYDIFPCEAGGGYFYDFTRTWCLGYAPDSVLKVYEDVKKVYDTLPAELKLNAPFANYQKRTCELFEAMGHPTIMTNPIARRVMPQPGAWHRITGARKTLGINGQSLAYRYPGPKFRIHPRARVILS